METLKKYSFVISDLTGFLTLKPVEGETFEDAKSYCERTLNSKHFVVSDETIIREFIEKEKAEKIEMFKQFPNCGKATQWFYDALEQLENQMDEKEVVEVESMMHVNLHQSISSEQEARLYTYLQNELNHSEFLVLDGYTIEEYLINQQVLNLFSYNVKDIMSCLKDSVINDIEAGGLHFLRSIILDVQEEGDHEKATVFIKSITDWRTLIVHVAERNGFGTYLSLTDGLDYDIDFENLELRVFKV